jgi:hypothetical protein
MNSKKFQILCNGEFIGYIFISNNHHSFPNLKIATIWTVIRKGSLENGFISLEFKDPITDIYDIHDVDEFIQNDLLDKAKISKYNCIGNFKIILVK